MRLVYISGVAFAALTVFSNSAYAGCTGTGCYQQVVNPAVYATHEHNVLVSPERRIAHRVAAQHRQVQETVVLRPERQVPRHVPATYSTFAETVLVAQAGRRWQVSTDAHGRTIGCWVDIPAQYTTRHRQVMVSPASTSYETIPAVVTTRTRTHMVRPASVEYQTVPAQYRTVAKQVLVQPASASWAPIGGHTASLSCSGRGFFGSTCGR